MTLKKLRKKYKMWLTLAFVFMVLMFVLIGLQIDGWVEVCMGPFLFPSLYARANIIMCVSFSSGVLRYKNMPL